MDLPHGDDVSATAARGARCRRTSVALVSTLVLGSGCAAPPGSVAECVRLVDVEGLADWRIVDDGVMGGRSRGSATTAADRLTFSGVIETDGGGFSSVRGRIDPSAIDGRGLLRLRVRTDGRPYEVILDDGSTSIGGRLSYFVPIDAGDEGEWVEVDAPISDAEARVFGTPRTADPFDPDRLVGLGIILADGVDGPFALDLEWIDACRG